MAGYVHAQKSLDVICQHKQNGDIIPLKIRLQDEDGEYQAYTVKAYRCTNLNKTINPQRQSVVTFECKITAFGREHVIGISYSFADGLWKVLGTRF
ncbi:MAG: hypothetical protein K6G04_00920 [Lachnospiraceae bacterium]|nr:hypothetical protein [Lachnospiraceae bacterium]